MKKKDEYHYLLKKIAKLGLMPPNGRESCGQEFRPLVRILSQSDDSFFSCVVDSKCLTFFLLFYYIKKFGFTEWERNRYNPGHNMHQVLNIGAVQKGKQTHLSFLTGIKLQLFYT